jgi:hypothetical protein
MPGAIAEERTTSSKNDAPPTSTHSTHLSSAARRPELYGIGSLIVTGTVISKKVGEFY